VLNKKRGGEGSKGRSEGLREKKPNVEKKLKRRPPRKLKAKKKTIPLKQGGKRPRSPFERPRPKNLSAV